MRKNSNVKQVTKNHFDTIAKDYNNSFDGKYVNSMYQELVNRVKQLPKKPNTILDLGCGNGNVMSLLSEVTDAQLYGIDLSEKMIEQGKQVLGEKVKFMVGDAAELPYEDKKFDIVICNASFHHYPKPELVLREIRRVLKQGGTLILGDPTCPLRLYRKVLNWMLKYSKSGDYHIYGKKEMINLLKKMGYEVSKWKSINMNKYILNAQITEI